MRWRRRRQTHRATRLKLADCTHLAKTLELQLYLTSSRSASSLSDVAGKGRFAVVVVVSIIVAVRRGGLQEN